MRNFVIVGTQRTGSSALAEALALHPDIACGWEWSQRSPFNKKISIAKESLSGDFRNLDNNNQKHMLGLDLSTIDWLGYRRLFRSSAKWIVHPRYSPALLVDRLGAHLRWFSSRPNIHVIHIIRRDNLAWIRSKVMSRASGKFFGEAYPEGLKESVNIHEAVKRLKAKNWVDQRLISKSASNPYLRIDYEGFLDDNRSAVNDALTFLGCDPSALERLKMKARKQSSSNKTDGILNYHELRTTLDRAGLLISEV